MAQTWKYRVILSALLASTSLSLWAAENSAVLDFDEEMEQSSAEVPIESIEQFVQIYGIVKGNYVQEKPDDALFLQAIKGLVSGLFTLFKP